MKQTFGLLNSWEVTNRDGTGRIEISQLNHSLKLFFKNYWSGSILTRFWHCEQLQMLKIIAVCRPTCVTHFYVLLAYPIDKDSSQQILIDWCISYQGTRGCEKAFEASFKYEYDEPLFCIKKRNDIKCTCKNPLSQQLSVHPYFLISWVIQWFLDHWNLLDRACFVVILTILFSLWGSLSLVPCIYPTF